MPDCNLNVHGIRVPDERWRKMKAVHDSCETAGVQLPEEVEIYFDGHEPDPSGILTDLADPIVTKWEREEDDDQEGIEIDLTQLPEGVTKLRVTISY
ncbi:MAG: hypothetical protein H6760_02125 [Candidatus Nomurabacteria bacterium]|nr:MAG: hypothetical protein H6760_02125 [Candidatus Nomurabacteria bacterium]